jgi:uncharacterized membrane protein YGL010W
MLDFEEQLDYYRSQHSTVGCKITHMFGVPLIAASLLLVLVGSKLASKCFIAGLALQFIGHYCFEKNRPVFLQEASNPMILASALIFAAEHWVQLLSGHGLKEELTKEQR